MLNPIGVLLLQAALAAESAASVAAMDESNASARLVQLIAATNLGAGEQAQLTTLAPELAAALAHEPTMAAMRLVLSFPPADIGRIRRGESVVRTEGRWSEKEGDAIAVLAKALDFRGKPDALQVRTEQAELVRFVLTKNGRDTSLAIVPPADWLSPGPGLVDPSFENPRTLGIAWQLSRGSSARAANEPVPIDAIAEVAFRDEQRTLAGASSLRVTTRRGETVEVRQRVGVSAGTELRVSAQAASDGAEPGVWIEFSGGGDPLRGAGRSGGDESLHAGSFQPIEVSSRVPDGATTVDIVLETMGEGSVNWDDVRLSVDGAGGGSRVTENGPLRVRHEGTTTVDIAAAAAEVSRAITVLGLPPDRPVLVESAKCADLPRCAVDAWVRRAWGAPKSEATAASIVDAALFRSSVYADTLSRQGGVALRTIWRGT